MLQQNKLAVAVAMTLGATLGGMSQVQAATEVLYFPHVLGGGAVASIVTLVNKDTQYLNNPSDGMVHLRLWHKLWVDSATSNDKECVEDNAFVETSENDILTFDLFNGGEQGLTGFGDAKGLMFENNINTKNVSNQNTVTYAIGDSLTLAQRGFLLVDNIASGTEMVNLRGEMFIFDFENGASWGYLPYRGASDSAAALAASVSGFQGTLPIMPFDEMITDLLVTPDWSSLATTTPATGIGTASSWVRADLYEGPTSVPGFYSRDEVASSKSNGVKVTCVGKINVESMLFGANGAPDYFMDGGWTNIRTYSNSSYNSTGGAAVFKNEYNTGDTFNGVPVGGVFNNAYKMNDTRPNN